MPFPYAHDQSVTQRITVACRWSGLRCKGSLERSNSAKQFGAVRRTSRPLCRRASVLSPVSLRPCAISFRQVGPARMTTCWPISKPAIENCKMSERLFSFRITSWHGSPLPNQATVDPQIEIHISIFDDMVGGSQQNIEPKRHYVPPKFLGWFRLLFALIFHLAVALDTHVAVGQRARRRLRRMYSPMQFHQAARLPMSRRTPLLLFRGAQQP